jgi:DNA repair photolyase
VRAELRRPTWKGEHVALGTNTDPYQWVESKYRLMEGIWEAMRDFANPCSVLTKSPLLLRDAELMKEISERTEFVANLSIPTLEEKAWRATEPHTPHPRKRIEAVRELSRAGIPTGVLIAPIIPGVNDAPGQVEELAEACGEAGAESIGGVGLHLRGEVREIWFEWLRQYRPDLISRYEELYKRGAYMPSKERDRLVARARGKRKPRRFQVRRGTQRPPAEERDRAEPQPGRQTALF